MTVVSIDARNRLCEWEHKLSGKTWLVPVKNHNFFRDKKVACFVDVSFSIQFIAGNKGLPKLQFKGSYVRSKNFLNFDAFVCLHD